MARKYWITSKLVSDPLIPRTLYGISGNTIDPGVAKKPNLASARFFCTTLLLWESVNSLACQVITHKKWHVIR